jgi:hypothetical protein
VGERERAWRRRLSIHGARPSKNQIVIPRLLDLPRLLGKYGRGNAVAALEIARKKSSIQASHSLGFPSRPRPSFTLFSTARPPRRLTSWCPRLSWSLPDGLPRVWRGPRVARAALDGGDLLGESAGRMRRGIFVGTREAHP